jgi:hypothetical protein
MSLLRNAKKEDSRDQIYLRLVTLMSQFCRRIV